MTTVSVRGTAADDRLTTMLPFIGRVLLAAIFVLSGLSKIADPAGTLAYIGSAGLPLPHVALVIAIGVEVIGGALLVIGYKARPVAAALAAFSLATAFGFHFNLGDQGQFINFFKNVAMAGGLLQVAAFGTGQLVLSSPK